MSSKIRRLTIGLFIEVTAGRGGYHSALWSGIADTIREHKANLLCFAGGALKFSPTDKFEGMRNIIYELVTSDNIDGLIISGTLGTFVTPKELVDFCDRYHPLKLVSTVVSLPRIPTVLVDNAKGMREMISHLILVHGYKRIGFISGPEHNPDADKRFQVFKEVLTEHNIPLDNDLIVSGDFFPNAGAQAIHTLFDVRNMDIQALVAANDNMALGAIEACQKRGIRVPEKLAIVGFDDIEEAGTAIPSLTTVQHPVYKQGKRAAEILLATLEGESVLKEETLETELIVRQSCGCSEDSVLPIELCKSKSGDKTFENLFETLREDLKSEMAKAVNGSSTKLIPEMTERLLNAFSRELSGKSQGLFLSTLSEILNEVTLVERDELPLHKIVSALYRNLPQYIEDNKIFSQAEILCLQAQIKIGVVERRTQAHRRLQAEQQTQTLNEINRALVTTHDIEEFVNVLAEGLPKLGILSCYISLYEDPTVPMERSRLILAYDSRGRTKLECGGRHYPSRQLLPNDMLLQEVPYNLVVEPLCFQENHLGFAVFDVGLQERMDCETLRGQLSSALWSSHLDQQQQKLIEQEKLLRKSSEEISSQLTLEEVSEKILDEVEEIVKYKKASLQLVQDDVRSLLASRGFDMKTANPWFHRKISEDRLISRVVNTQEPLILSNTVADSDWVSHSATADIKSWVGVPLVYAQEVIGLLTLDHDQPGFYTPAVKRLLASFAHQAAIDLRKAYLFNIAEERIKHLEIINNVAQIMTKQLGTEDLLDTIASQIVERLECTRCAIFFPKIENDEQVLTPQVVKAENESLITDRRFKFGEGLAGWVFQHGQSLILPDATKDTRFVPAQRNINTPRPMLVVPIKSADQTIGIISTDQNTEAWFGENKKQIIEALALQAGIAIERSAGLELLQNIGNRIASLQDMDLILHEIVRGAIKLTNTTTGVIYLVSEDGESVLKSFYPPGFDHPLPRLNMKESLTRQVIMTGRVLRVLDVRNDPRVNPALRDQFRSMIAVPLILEKKVIGAFYLNDEDYHNFSETEVAMLLTLASQASIAIEKARLLQERKLQLDKLTTLLDDQKRTTEVQARLIDLMSHTNPSDSLIELLLVFMDEIEKWPVIMNATVLEPSENGEYNIDSCKFLNDNQLVLLKEKNFQTVKEPFELPENVLFSPVIIGDSKPTFIITQIDPKQDDITRHWLQMARLIIQYLNEIGQLLKETERLRNNNEERQTQALVGAVSRLYNHEILNGLKAITSWIANARRGTPNLDALANRVDELHEKIREVMNATDFSRVRRAICVFNNEMEKALTRLNFRHLRKLDGCDLHLNITGHKHRKTEIDPNSLIPVLNNLVLNAQEQYQLVKKKGPIQISIIEKIIGEKLFIGFEVLDYAVGIPDENRDKVFKPGWSTKPDGQGLGLWIVQKLVEACEGQIILESTHGHYTKFSVIYPVIKEDE